ncbi:MAG TPA: hypothetical protein VJ600_10125 [Holophagaceae bacterium]|nr:hypothetical protein [Holophagaceae bacterium]
MTDGQTPAPAPSTGMNPVLKWVLIGCGTIALFMVLALGACTFIGYRMAKNAKAELEKQGVKVDTSHGFKGAAYSMTVGMVQAMKPGVLLALPKEEHAAADKAFTDLASKSGTFTDQDMTDLSAAMDAYNKANKANFDGGAKGLLPDPARKFVADIQGIADRH